MPIPIPRKPVPGTVAAQVRRAHRSQRSACLGQAVLVGVASGLGFVCLALWCGALRPSGDALGVGVAGGLLAFGLFWGASRRPIERFVLRLDDRAGLQGDLIAALRSERRQPITATGQLLLGELKARRVYKQLNSLGVDLHVGTVLLPFLAGAILHLTIQGVANSNARWMEVAPLLSGLEGSLNRLTDTSPELARRLSGQVREWQREAEFGVGDPEEWSRELEQVGDELDRLGLESARSNMVNMDRERVLEDARERVAMLQERVQERWGLEAVEPEGVPLDSGDSRPPGALSDSSDRTLAESAEDRVAGGLLEASETEEASETGEASKSGAMEQDGQIPPEPGGQNGGGGVDSSASGRPRAAQGTAASQGGRRAFGAEDPGQEIGEGGRVELSASRPEVSSDQSASPGSLRPTRSKAYRGIIARWVRETSDGR